MEDYVKAVIKELRYYSVTVPNFFRNISAVHFGGGTPTALGTKGLKRIIEAIRANFTLSRECLISIEAHLRDMQDIHFLAELVECGINRVSFGVQSFSESIRKKYGLVPISHMDIAVENSIRETVFLGDYNFVRDNVNGYKNATINLMEKLNLYGICEAANDPFFLAENASKRINTQKMFGSKYELRLNLDNENSTAVGSFNLHGNFLAKRFGLYSDKKNKKYCFTGCIGIGLERLIFCFLTQYGIGREHWPELIIEGIENPKSIEKNIKSIL